jgi:thiamine pyrophosphate-dependent acetolactate synthase large subunit-like protein
MCHKSSAANVAEAYLELLASRGIEYLFGDSGTDFAPIIEAFAKRSEIKPSLDYEKICQAAGGYGERVTNAADLPAAIDRAIEVIESENRQALLNVICR